MTEAGIIEIERAQSDRQATLKAVMHAQRVNPDFDEDRLNFLAHQFPQIGKLVRNTTDLQDLAIELSNTVNLEDDQRFDQGAAAYEQPARPTTRWSPSLTAK